MGLLPHDCAIRQPHGFMSRKVDRKCKKCSAQDAKIALAKKMLQTCKSLMENVKRIEAKLKAEREEMKNTLKRPRREFEAPQSEQDGSKGGILPRNRTRPWKMEFPLKEQDQTFQRRSVFV